MTDGSEYLGRCDGKKCIPFSDSAYQATSLNQNKNVLATKHPLCCVINHCNLSFCFEIFTLIYIYPVWNQYFLQQAKQLIV